MFLNSTLAHITNEHEITQKLSLFSLPIWSAITLSSDLSIKCLSQHKYGCLQKYAFFHSPFKIPLRYILEYAIKYIFFCVSHLHSSDFTTHPKDAFEEMEDYKDHLIWGQNYGLLNSVLSSEYCGEAILQKRVAHVYLLIIMSLSILYTNIILSSTDITSSITIFSQHSRLDMNSGSWDPPVLKSKRLQKIIASELQSFCFPGIL